MKIERLVFRLTRVPLKRPFRTAQTERTHSDNVVVEAMLDDGTRGFGEGVPRDYVTGETPDACLDFLPTLAHELLAMTFADFADAVAFASGLSFGDDPEKPRCAARAAIEIALLDAAGQRFGVPLYRLIDYLPELASIAQVNDAVRYGVVLSADTRRRKALIYRLYGFHDAKLKVGLDPEQDIAFVTGMRRLLGRRMDIRLDANGGWSFDDALKTMRALDGLSISFVEQPIANAEAGRLAELRAEAPIPVMLDESLISERDVRLAIEQKRCDAFNLRISKNGGMIPVLRYAKLAAENGIAVQLGCHPGETGLLSAAGRALACAVGNLRYLEGSYDRHQLRKNVIRENITFGRGGRARRLKKAGLGVTVDEDALEEMTVEEVTVGRRGESER